MSVETEEWKKAALQRRDGFVGACMELAKLAKALEFNDIEGYRNAVEKLLEVRKLGDTFAYDFSDQSTGEEGRAIYRLWDEYRNRKDAACIRDLRQIENGEWF